MLMDITWALAFSSWIYLTWTSRLIAPYPEWWIQLLILASPGVAAFWLLRTMGPHLSRFLAQRSIKRGLYRDYVGETEVAVSPSQLCYQNSKQRVSIAWDTVHRVECKSTQILFCLQNGGGIFLPRRVFASEVQEQEFLTLIARYRSHAGLPVASESVSTVPASAVAPGTSTPWYQSRHSLDTETRDVQRVGQGNAKTGN